MFLALGSSLTLACVTLILRNRRKHIAKPNTNMKHTECCVCCVCLQKDKNGLLDYKLSHEKKVCHTMSKRGGRVGQKHGLRRTPSCNTLSAAGCSAPPCEVAWAPARWKSLSTSSPLLRRRVERAAAHNFKGTPVVRIQSRSTMCRGKGSSEGGVKECQIDFCCP